MRMMIEASRSVQKGLRHFWANPTLRILSFSVALACGSTTVSGTALAEDKESGAVIGVTGTQQEKPLVLSSIKPLTMIAKAVLDGEADVKQLLPDQEIPHHYSMRVSDRRLFEEADLLLWIGPQLEGFMASLAATRKPSAVITAAELKDIVWPDATDRGRDYHLWLNPENAVLIARALVAHVAAIEGVNHTLLAQRLAIFESEMDVLKQKISKRLLPLNNNKFIVDHDAFRHFTETFLLRNSGFLRDSNGLEIGVREKSLLMAQQGVRCVVAEPESRIARMQHLANALGANLVVIDPLGAQLAAQLVPKPLATPSTLLVQPEKDGLARQPSGYAQLIQGIAESFISCLSD